MTFVIFELSKPVQRWTDGVGLGFPNVAPGHVQAASDVISRPKVPTSGDMLGGFLSGVSPLALLAILYFMSKGK